LWLIPRFFGSLVWTSLAAWPAHAGTDSVAAGMRAPDLKRLQLGDADAWDTAFDWLWPTALAVAAGRKLKEVRAFLR